MTVYDLRGYTVEVWVTEPRLAIRNGDYLTPEKVMRDENMLKKLLNAMEDDVGASGKEVGFSESGAWHEEIWPTEASNREDKTHYYRLCFEGMMDVVPDDTESEAYKIMDAIQERIPDAEVRVAFTPEPNVEAEYGDDV